MPRPIVRRIAVIATAATTLTAVVLSVVPGGGAPSAAPPSTDLGALRPASAVSAANIGDVLSYPTNVTFTIRNGMNGLVFDMPGDDSNFTNGAQVQQWADVNGVDQRWKLQPSSTSNAYQIVNNLSGKVNRAGLTGG